MGGADGDAGFAEGGADAAGGVGAGEADRGFGGGQGFRPVWPVLVVAGVVGDQPQGAEGGAVGRARAYLAEQVSHGVPLAHRVDVAELRSPDARPGWHPLPQNTVVVAIAEYLVGVGDTGGTFDHGGG